MAETSLSDKAIIIGILALGVYFGTYFLYDEMNIDVSDNTFVIKLLQYTLIIGILLLISGIGYKIIKWKLS